MRIIIEIDEMEDVTTVRRSTTAPPELLAQAAARGAEDAGAAPSVVEALGATITPLPPGARAEPGVNDAGPAPELTPP